MRRAELAGGRPGAAVVLVLAAGVLLGAAEDSPTKRSMHQLYESLAALLPWSLDAEAFGDPARTQEIQGHLRRVAAEATAVRAHAAGRDQGTRYLGRGLELEARQARELFALGAVSAARIGVLQMTEYCVACHTRLPVPSDSPVARGFLEDDVLQSLDSSGRAQLQIAMRRFEDGLDTLESALAEPDLSGPDLLATVTSYLAISIRVKNDFERPLPILRRLSEDPRLWSHLQLDVERWTQALGELQELGASSSRLEDAASVLAAGRELLRLPSDRQALVHYITATAILERFLDSGSGTNADRARAYYLLGVTESRIESGYWMALPRFYLETAIRLEPAGPVARSAYAIIEETTMCEYSTDCSAAPGELPEDVQAYLDELRGLTIL